mgnify:CR=1 FL=1
MGFENRDYQREGWQGGGGGFGRGGGFGGGMGGRLAGASITTWLLGINAVVFLIDAVLQGALRAGGFTLSAWGDLTLAEGVYGFQIWRLFTFQFLHGNLLHILFNCIALYFFGPLVEQWWGSRRFLAFYLLCGVIAGIAYVLIVATIPSIVFPEWFVTSGEHLTHPLVGASGGIFGILVATALLFPKLKVMLLIPPVPMTMRTMALIFLGIAVFSVLVGGRNAGGQLAHLGGAAMGYFLVRYPGLVGWADRVGGGGGRRNGGLGGLVERAKQAQQQRDEQKRANEDQEVDRILDKVREHGLQSLSGAERRTLQRATDRHRGGG